MQQRLPSLHCPPIGFAHRGARAHARENTLDAFALGLRLGATGLESDVWLTRDGVCVLDHDGVVRQGLRKRPISAVARESLPPHIPTLGELLERCGTDYHLSLDLKDEDSGAAVIESIRRIAPSMLPRVWLCHHDWRAVAALRALSGEVNLVDSTRLSRVKEGPERRAALLAEHGVNCVNMHHSDWSGGLTTLFHRFNLYVLAWDLQQPAQLAKLIRMGVDGVFSDWTDRMMEAITDQS